MLKQLLTLQGKASSKNQWKLPLHSINKGLGNHSSSLNNMSRTKDHRGNRYGHNAGVIKFLQKEYNKKLRKSFRILDVFEEEFTLTENYRDDNGAIILEWQPMPKEYIYTELPYRKGAYWD